MALKREYGRGPTEPRNYLEAYPALSAVDASRGFENDAYSHCVWIDSNERVVAAADLRWDGAERLLLRFGEAEIDENMMLAGEVVIDVVYKGSRSDNQRALLICPRCRYARSSLVLMEGQWHCRRCHGLHYRSTRIGSWVVKAEKYRRLREELRLMETAMRRADVIARKKRVVAAALARVGPRPHPVASTAYSYIVSFLWSGASLEAVQPDETA
jgi:hypothetical protein